MNTDLPPTSPTDHSEGHNQLPNHNKPDSAESAPVSKVRDLAAKFMKMSDSQNPKSRVIPVNNSQPLHKAHDPHSPPQLAPKKPRRPLPSIPETELKADKPPPPLPLKPFGRELGEFVALPSIKQGLDSLTKRLLDQKVLEYPSHQKSFSELCGSTQGMITSLDTKIPQSVAVGQKISTPVSEKDIRAWEVEILKISMQLEEAHNRLSHSMGKLGEEKFDLPLETRATLLAQARAMSEVITDQIGNLVVLTNRIKGAAEAVKPTGIRRFPFMSKTHIDTNPTKNTVARLGENLTKSNLELEELALSITREWNNMPIRQDAKAVEDKLATNFTEANAPTLKNEKKYKNTNWNELSAKMPSGPALEARGPGTVFLEKQKIGAFDASSLSIAQRGKGQKVENRNQDRLSVSEFTIRGEKIAYFSVMDGHGGNAVADIVQKELLNYVKIRLEGGSLDDDAHIYNALNDAFVTLNTEIRSSQDPEITRSGATACVSLMINGSLWTANTGDSRAIVVTDTELFHLSEDTDLDKAKWRARLEERGGQTTQMENGAIRVKAGRSIEVSESFGDAHAVGMSAHPDITKWTPSDAQKPFKLILATDSLWGRGTSEEVAATAREVHDNLAQVLASKAANVQGTVDDTTVIVAEYGK